MKILSLALSEARALVFFVVKVDPISNNIRFNKTLKIVLDTRDYSGVHCFLCSDFPLPNARISKELNLKMAAIITISV